MIQEGRLAQVFPKRADVWLGRAAVAAVLLGVYAVAGTYYYGPPEYTRVGYAPVQPVAFSHAQHVGQLGMSCLYCHTHVEASPHSNVPTTQTCMNCHQQIKANSPLLAAVRESWASNDPIPWVRVHKVPDYVQFNHATHVKRGVGCVSCHGKVNEMPVVHHDQPQSMGWCLNCHRHPENYLRPNSEILNFDWAPPAGKTQAEVGRALAEKSGINAVQECSACHR